MLFLSHANSQSGGATSLALLQVSSTQTATPSDGNDKYFSMKVDPPPPTPQPPATVITDQLSAMFSLHDHGGWRPSCVKTVFHSCERLVGGEG